MQKFEVAYVPVGVMTFHLESAGAEFEKSKKLLKNIYSDVKCPNEMLLSMDLLDNYLDTVKPDLVILQNVTFANAEYTAHVLHKCECPILLWTLREPVIDGGRLRLNSLTGAYSASNTVMNYGEKLVGYVFGAPQEENVLSQIKTVVTAAKLKFDMQNMTIAQIGHTPQGFGFGRAMDTEMLKTFGVSLLSIEARELIDKAKSFTDDDIIDYLADADKKMVGLGSTPEKNRYDFARLYKAYDEYVKANNITALSSRCWPDFFTSFGTPVCAVLAMMNDLGISASCEADTYGALSMMIAQKLTNSPVFFGDPVSMDEKENTVTFWHCGTAACSLAREDTGAAVGVHCNRKIGPTLEFGCKPSDNVTIFRVSKKADGTFRFFIAQGEALDKPKQFNGTSVVVKTKNNARELVENSVMAGYEPHFVVAYGNIFNELQALANLFDTEVDCF